MSRFRKLTLDEAAQELEVLDPATCRSLKGGGGTGLMWQDPNDPLNAGLYSMNQFNQMMNDNYGIMPLGLGTEDNPTYLDEVEVNSPEYCEIHSKHFNKPYSCPGCDTDQQYSENAIDQQFYDAHYNGSDGYPSDNNNNNNNNSGFVGGGSTGPSAPSTGLGGILNDVNLTDKKKFVGYNTSGDCLTGCKQIMKNYDVATGDSNHVYQLLQKEGESQKEVKLSHYGDNPETNYTYAIDCINQHLDSSRPIIIGLAYQEYYGNSKTTTHFVVITGRGYDMAKGQYYYNYMETAISDETKACDTKENRLYYDSINLKFSNTNNYLKKAVYVSEVRPNDGKLLNQTTISIDQKHY